MHIILFYFQFLYLTHLIGFIPLSAVAIWSNIIFLALHEKCFCPTCSCKESPHVHVVDVNHDHLNIVTVENDLSFQNIVNETVDNA